MVDVPGAIYRDELNQAREQGRITGVPCDRAALVNTYWDLGVGSNMQIICAQRVGREYHWIDHYAGIAGNAPEAAAWLRSTGYAFGDHFLPHDAGGREKGTGLTFEEQLEQLWFRSRMLPRLGGDRESRRSRRCFRRSGSIRASAQSSFCSLMHYRRDWLSHDIDRSRQLAPKRPVQRAALRTTGWTTAVGTRYRRRVNPRRSLFDPPQSIGCCSAMP